MSLELAGPISGEFFAGNDQAWEFTVTIDGVVVDLTAMTCRFAMGRQGFLPALGTELSPPNVVATVGSPPTDGVFTIIATADDTADLLGTYQYQAQVENAAGERSNILHGYFTFRKNIVEPL